MTKATTSNDKPKKTSASQQELQQPDKERTSRLALLISVSARRGESPIGKAVTKEDAWQAIKKWGRRRPYFCSAAICSNSSGDCLMPWRAPADQTRKPLHHLFMPVELYDFRT
jgi:hypothetical protein